MTDKRTDITAGGSTTDRVIHRTDYSKKMPRHIYAEFSQEATSLERASALNPADPANNAVDAKPKPATHRKGSYLALLISAHNEEMVLAGTLRSAIRAGMSVRHIYVVDDNSHDDTAKIAKSIIGDDNVISVGRSGKGLALTKAAAAFQLTDRYKWIHIADADGGFAKDYFKIFRKSLDPANAAATGYIRSLPGSMIGQYRVYEYTIGMEIHRRFQALTHTIAIIPGPTSCFRADVFAQVDFANKSLTEDFDVTLQIHRKKLGHIQYIPEAVAYTQDPRNYADFTKQITRWNRGVMQGMRRHKIGLRLSRVDAYLSYQMMLNLLLLANYAVALPLMVYRTGSLQVVALAFLFDVGMLFILTMMTALKAGRLDILSALPQIYVCRWITLYVFTKSFIEVMILQKFRTTEGSWSTAGRRFKNTAAF